MKFTKQTMPIFDDIKYNFKTGGLLTKLLYINLGVFIVSKLVFSIFNVVGIENLWLRHLELPATLDKLIYQPWSLLSYMFLHLDFFHVLFNLLALYWFGNLFLRFFSQKQLVGNYIISGLGGALLYLLGYNLLPSLQGIDETAYLLGASGSVMGIIFAAVVYAPNYKVNLALIGEVKLLYLGLAFLGFDLLTLTATNAGSFLAHLGGALAGSLFAYLLTKKGLDISSPISKTFDYLSTFKNNYSRASKPTNKRSDAQWNQKNKSRDERIDVILDKIKKSGYEGLSKEEKKLLFDMSNNK